MIALNPKYSVSSDALTLTVTDKTSQYSPINLGGFDPAGTANPKASETTVCEVRIALRNSDGTFGTETTIDAYPTLPSDIAGTFDILSTDAGQGGSYADGVYRITYVVQGVWVSNGSIPFLATKALYIPIVTSICACWQKKAAAFAAQDCNCSDDETFDTISLYMFLLNGAIECQDVNSMQAFIDKLTKLCDSSCGCSD